MDPLKVPKLLPVITLGFPLGRRTQETAINVSVTTGHVRRAFENFLQVDTSLYRGNGGGPLIDIHGKVIGIASSVAVDWAVGPLPSHPLSDLGMVLPIAGGPHSCWKSKPVGLNGTASWTCPLTVKSNRSHS